MKNFIVILFLSFTQIAVSQTQVAGQVIDAKDNSFVPFATVAVYTVKDTMLIAGAITANNGRFTIPGISQGNYILRVSFVGYTSLYKTFEISDDRRQFNVGTIELQKGVMLSQAEITQTRIPVIVRGDTVDYSADAFRPIEGAMLEELLKRLPGVQIDRDGKITAQGKTITQILVEGEIFFTDNPQVALQNIPADFVQTVQVYERKSDVAKFTGVDDGKEENVINLQLKPEMKLDWFGRLRLGGGLDASNNPVYANSANITNFSGSNQLMILGNMNNTKWFAGDNNRIDDGVGGVFQTGGNDQVGITKVISPMVNYVRKVDSTWLIRTSYQYQQDDQRYNSSFFREDILPTGSQFRNTEGSRMDIYSMHRFNTEIKYMPNSNNEFIIQPSITANTRDCELESIFEMKDDTLAMINHGLNQRTFEHSRTTAQLQLSYGHRFTKPQHTLRVSLTGALGGSRFKMYDYAQHHVPNFSSDTLDKRQTDNSNSTDWNTNVVYTEPLARNFVLSLNYSISNNESRDEQMQYIHNPVTNAYDLLDTAHSANYGSSVFRQNLLIQLQKTAQKYNYMVGFGLIPSKIVNRMDGLSDILRDDFSIAPQARFRYSFSRQSRLELRYNGATRQPSVHQLRRIPDIYELNIRVGNPELKPEFSHRINATFNNFSEKMHTLNTSLSFVATQNKITTSTIYDQSLFPQAQLDSSVFRPGTRISMPDNVGSAYTGGASISYGMPLFSERLYINVSVRGNLGQSKSMVDKDLNVMNNLSLTERLQITYRRERFDVGLEGQFNMSNVRYSLLSERNNTNYRNHVNTNFSWHIIKNKLTLSSDMQYETSTGLQNYNYTSTIWNAQLSYNIGKSNNAQLLLQIVDILNDRNEIWRDASDTYIEYMKFNTLRRFFLVSFIYSKKQKVTK